MSWRCSGPGPALEFSYPPGRDCAGGRRPRAGSGPRSLPVTRTLSARPGSGQRDRARSPRPGQRPRGPGPRARSRPPRGEPWGTLTRHIAQTGVGNVGNVGNAGQGHDRPPWGTCGEVPAGRGEVPRPGRPGGPAPGLASPSPGPRGRARPAPPGARPDRGLGLPFRLVDPSEYAAIPGAIPARLPPGYRWLFPGHSPALSNTIQGHPESAIRPDSVSHRGQDRP
jgi:hypothetical protein